MLKTIQNPEKMNQDELLIKRFCKEYKLKLKRIDSYTWEQPGYVVNSEGRIEILNLFDLKITNIPEYITELSELKILNLVGNELTSIKEIGNLTKLETLVIQANEITDISIMEKLIALKEFHALINPITDITPLEHLENLETLAINAGEGINLDTINLPNLVDVALSDVSQSTNISFLRNCKKIKSLYIRGNYGKKNLSIDFFENIQHLELFSLIISGMSQLNVEKLKLFQKLKSIKDLRL